MPTVEEIAAAEAYEELFVEGLFAEWAPRVADAAGIGEGDRVLDVACGTGVLAREIAARVGSAGEVVGIDAAGGMLAVAEREAPDIDWHLGVAEELPFESGSFDAVVSQFGLMFFRDRRRALEEMRRVMRPGAGFGVAVWGELGTNPAYAVEVELLERQAGSAAADALRAPFALGDREEIVSLFSSAGFHCEVETIAGLGRFPSIRTMVEADLRGWLPLMGVPLADELIASILNEAEEALSSFRTDDGRVEFLSTALVARGTSPIGDT